MVVMNDGKLVHDPHPSNAGLGEVQCVWLLAKKAGPQWHHDERAAFEASAKAYTSNVSFERDEHDYADMTASLLWHGWKLRAARAPAESVQDLQSVHDAVTIDLLNERVAYLESKLKVADSVLEDAADPLQGAANWLAEAHGQFCVAVLQGCLMIGYNRAKRLHDAALAARKQGGAT